MSQLISNLNFDFYVDGQGLPSLLLGCRMLPALALRNERQDQFFG